MNALNPALELETDALRGDVRPSKLLLRPIPYPPKHQIRQIGGER
jgi:hypothetical protein